MLGMISHLGSKGSCRKIMKNKITKVIDKGRDF